MHLLQAENKELSSLPPVDKEINSRDDHLSFQVWNRSELIIERIFTLSLLENWSLSIMMSFPMPFSSALLKLVSFY